MFRFVTGDALRLPLLDRSVDLTFGSPPYLEQRIYGRSGIARNTGAWVNWMLAASKECLRVTRGAVCWVVGGATKAGNYQPGPEGLIWEWFKQGGECHQFRPFYFGRSGIPGSGGKQWFRSNVEYVLCLRRPGPLPYANPLAQAKPCKYGPGGKMSHRTKKDARVVHEKGHYKPPKLANPGNYLYMPVGRGHMGHDFAHFNEAPFPEELAKWFILWGCPPGGVVLDPFSGSGTTASMAVRLGRRGIGLDLRHEQNEIGQRRTVDQMVHPETIDTIEPLAVRMRKAARNGRKLLRGQRSFI